MTGFSDDDILTISELRSMNRLKVNYRMKVHETLPELLKNYEKLLLMKAELKKFYQKGYDQTKKDFKDSQNQTDPLPRTPPLFYFKIFIYKFLCSYMPERPPIILDLPKKVERLHKETNTELPLHDDKFLQTSIEYIASMDSIKESAKSSLKPAINIQESMHENSTENQKRGSTRGSIIDKDGPGKYELEFPKSIEKYASESMRTSQPVEILRKDEAVQYSLTGSSWRPHTPDVRSTVRNEFSSPAKLQESIQNPGPEDVNATVSSAKGTLSQESPTREVTNYKFLQNVTEKDAEDDTERYYEMLQASRKSPEEIEAERRAIQERVLEGIRNSHRENQIGNPLINQTKFLYNVFDYGRAAEVKSFWKHILPDDIFGDKNSIYYGYTPTELSQGYVRTEWTTNYATQPSPHSGMEIQGQGPLNLDRINKREQIQKQLLNEKKKFIGYQVEERANYQHAPRQSSGSPKGNDYSN